MTKLSDYRYAMDHCNKCHSCKQSPALESQSFSSICPSYDFGVFHSYSAAGKLAAAYGVMEGRFGYDDRLRRNIYACSMCGACQTACTWNHDHVDPLESLYALRERMAEDGQSPQQHRDMLESLRTNGNPYGLPRQSRMAWAEGLSIRSAGVTRAEVLLHVGASFAYLAPDEIRAVARLLQASAVDFAVLLEDEPEFGSLAFDLGFPTVAREMGEQALSRIAATKAAKLVVCGGDTLSAIRAVHPRLGVNGPTMECLHITEFLETLVKGGALRFQPRRQARVAYHDACKLGRLSEPWVPWKGEIKRVLNSVDIFDPPHPIRSGAGGVFDAPRAMLRAAGIEPIEFERRREFSYCCGGSAGAKETYPGFGETAARSRRAEARAVGADSITTACALCTAHLVNAPGGEKVPVEGLFSLLAGALAPGRE
jgi:Fe-S oxidoreductase